MGTTTEQPLILKLKHITLYPIIIKAVGIIQNHICDSIQTPETNQPPHNTPILWEQLSTLLKEYSNDDLRGF